MTRTRGVLVVILAFAGTAVADDSRAVEKGTSQANKPATQSAGGKADPTKTKGAKNKPDAAVTPKADKPAATKADKKAGKNKSDTAPDEPLEDAPVEDA